MFFDRQQAHEPGSKAAPQAGFRVGVVADLITIDFSDGIKQTQIDTFDTAGAGVGQDTLWNADDRANGSLLSVVDADTGADIDGTVEFVAAADTLGDATLAGADTRLIFTPTSLSFCRFGYSQNVQVTLDGALESDRSSEIVVGNK